MLLMLLAWQIIITRSMCSSQLTTGSLVCVHDYGSDVIACKTVTVRQL